MGAKGMQRRVQGSAESSTKGAGPAGAWRARLRGAIAALAWLACVLAAAAWAGDRLAADQGARPAQAEDAADDEAAKN
jgi:hypothetical protein